MTNPDSPETPINVTSAPNVKIDTDFNEESDARHEPISLKLEQPTKIDQGPLKNAFFTPQFPDFSCISADVLDSITHFELSPVTISPSDLVRPVGNITSGQVLVIKITRLEGVRVDPAAQLFGPRKVYPLIGGCGEFDIEITVWMLERGAFSIRLKPTLLTIQIAMGELIETIFLVANRVHSSRSDGIAESERSHQRPTRPSNVTPSPTYRRLVRSLGPR
jgi:hypothetical protein